MSTLSTDQLLHAYRVMRTIRAFEERLHVEFATGEIPGFVHLYAGEEASAAGVMAHLRDDDCIASTHRGHGHCIAKGVDVHGMMAEIYGKKTGVCQGKGGSMHIADLEKGMLGANGIVGAGAPLAAGAALAAKLKGSDAVAVGFFAQVIDGALGMAYGITATTFLLSAGATPAAASASVHIAEVFTTGFSGISHVKLGNVNKSLFLRLLLPGMIGAVLGAVLITRFDGHQLKPFISAYLLLMGLYILSKAYRHVIKRRAPRHVAKLALFGGFVDAAGGGGWGPVVTSSLIGSGSDPRTTIGSVNFAEFFLTIASATSFILLAGQPDTWKMVAGLVFGGLFAAPFAALLCKKLSPRTLLVIVGTLITLISAYNIYIGLR